MLRELAKSEKVDERVLFLGQIDHKEMPKYLRVSDIFIRPSRSEGMGNSFVEAMAAELPVIATQEGGISDFLFDEKKNPSVPSTGWAVSKDSPREIADAVNDILDRPDKTQEVIKTAKRLACEKYDWDLIAHNMNIQVFHRLIS
jgi:glycosyltransferase involved in cell wall biosynthesis